MTDINVREERVSITTPDGTADGFLYRPESREPLPGVIHLTDIAGVRESQREMSRQLASEGFVVLLPNIFYRTPLTPPYLTFPIRTDDPETKQTMNALGSPLTPEAVARDASAYVDFLGGVEGVQPERIGVVGYCFAGGIALRIAAARPDVVKAAASFHGGRLATDDAFSPHRLLSRVQASLYFGHARDDRSMPAEAIRTLEMALAEWGGDYTSTTYDALHGWMVSDHPTYDPGEAERGHERLLDLLRRTLG